MKTEMEKIIESIEVALDNKNWYVVLFACLALPDICGKIDFLEKTPRERYIEWFNKYLLSKYTHEIGPEHTKHVFLCGEDCYALRCSYLHEGSDIISEQRVKEVLDNFKFVAPPLGGMIHRNQVNSTLQLQIDIFCNDILQAVKQWLEDIKDDLEKQKKLNNLMKVYYSFKF